MARGLRGPRVVRASKNLEKTGVGASWASGSLLRNHWGLETAPRALPEASGRPQGRFGKPRDGPKSALGGPKAAPGALQEPSERLPDCSGSLRNGFKSAPRASERLQERSQRPQDGFRSFSGALGTTPTLEMAALGASGLLRASIFEQQFRIQSKMLFEKAARFNSTRNCKLRASWLRACYARVHSSIYIYIVKHI